MIPTLVITAALLGTDVPKTGTILYLERSNLVVERVTGSPLSHVAMVVQIGGQPWVYEATPAEVRRVALAHYLGEIAQLNQSRSTQIRVFSMRPRRTLSSNQVQSLRAYLDVQLGRRYSVTGYLRGRSGDGIQCAELLGHALDRTGCLKYEHHHRLSPVEFVKQAEPAYQKPIRMELPELQPEATWCDQQWDWWFGLVEWWQWAWDETWRFRW